MTLRHDISRVVDAVTFAYSRPVCSYRVLPKIVAWISVTAALTLIDRKVQRTILKTKRSTRDQVERIGYRYGKPLSPILLTATTYVIGTRSKDRWWHETALRLAATSIATGILQTSMKYLIGRARPYLNEGNLKFKPFSKSHGYQSFLSGHTAVSLGMSMVMIERVRHASGDIFFYTLAIVTGLSRLYSNAHWLSDVWTGVWLARVCVKLTGERLNETEGYGPLIASQMSLTK
jgi:membrane-associated phospholipid phosphatase